MCLVRHIKFVMYLLTIPKTDFSLMVAVVGSTHLDPTVLSTEAERLRNIEIDAGSAKLGRYVRWSRR